MSERFLNMSRDLQNRIRALRTTERRITPDAAWVRATRNTLLMQVRNALPPQTHLTRIEHAHRVLDEIVVQKIGHLLRKPIMAILSLVAVMTGGSMMSVSAAERSLPGDFLYGLKLATEQARLAWVSAKEEKLKLKTEFTGRRIQEIKDVVGTNKVHNDRVKQVAEILKSDFSTLKEQLGDVKKEGASDKVVAAAKLVDQKSNEVINALQATRADLSAETRQKITEAQSAAADVGVKAIEVLVEKQAESNNIIPVADVAEIIQNHANAVANLFQTPLELTGAVSSPAVTSTVASLLQAIATSTASGGTTMPPLPQLVNQVKDVTAQIFAIQKTKDSSATTSSSQTMQTPP